MPSSAWGPGSETPALGTVGLPLLRLEAAMAHLERQRRGDSVAKHHGLALLAMALLMPPGAWAQIADVVRPDAQGEFLSVRVPGPRGSTAQRFWLVVDRDPRGLACRDVQGRAWISLRYGSVVQLDQPEQQMAPLLIQGKPYLRLAIQPMVILHDARFRDRGQPTSCRVRANSAFLAPIQEDSLQQVRLTP